MKAAAVASGAIFSVVYLGNIVNAVSAADRWNRAREAPFETELREALFPDLRPE